MFSVEMIIKIDGRSLTLDEFAERIVARALEGVRKDIQTIRVSREVPQQPVVVQRDTEPRAVGIERAAELLGISPHTVRKYVREGTLRAIRAGRRVLIPMTYVTEWV